VVLAVAILLSVPYAAAVVGALEVGWRPSNDDALIALRVHDVLAGEWPQLGQPSTAEHYAGSEIVRHPGPIQFYLFAPVVALVGANPGLLLGAAAANLGAVLVAAWVLFRRAGPKVGLLGAIALSLLAWAQGPVQLVDPISSNMGGITLVGLAVLAWAVIDGDARLLPLMALSLAFVAQQHLAVFGLAGGLGAVAVLVLVVTMARRRDGAAVPWLLGAVAVSLVAWAPVLVDQFTGTGNLGRFLTFAGSSDRPDLGWAAGARQAARAIGFPPLVWRTDLTGDDIHVALSPFAWFGAAAVGVALVAVVVADRRRRPSRAALAGTVLVLVVLGVITGSNVPASVEAARLNLYRWTFVASVLAWSTLGWKAASMLAARFPTLIRDPRRIQLAGAAGVLLLAWVTVAAVVAGGPRVWRDEVVFDAEARLSAAIEREVAGFDRVLVVPVGAAAEFSVAPALVVDLVEAGHLVGVPPSQEAGYGRHLVSDGDYDAALVVVSGFGEAQAWPGRTVARVDLNESSSAARAILADQVRGRDLEVSSTADEVLTELMGDPNGAAAGLFSTFMLGLADEPEKVLAHGLAGRALAAGYFDGLELDEEALATLVDNPPVEVWNDDVLEVRMLTPAEIDEHRDALMGAGLGRPVA